MTNEELIAKVTHFVRTSPDNHVSAEDAIYPELAGLKMYDDPIFGFAAADDTLFTETFKREGVIHPTYMAPAEWLGGCKTVISFFLPFTAAVRESNRGKTDEPYAPGISLKCSAAWLHARIEGQAFMDKVTDYIQQLLEGENFESVCPTTSGKLRMITPYISTWSERHAAYAAGLGTFGLSKGLITEKGMAGRFGSVITNAEFQLTPRPYDDPFAYCTMCGICMIKCPAHAIDKEKGCALGKDQNVCGACLQESHLPPHGPNQRVRYDCGKCQVGTPCESGIPKRGSSPPLPLTQSAHYIDNPSKMR
ncbi:MAG: epoxyqueuosine reductase [Oscillospiraceae bacterium]|nr:epoxyqueuosine reductase [Oscillospiraceae bacterium]